MTFQAITIQNISGVQVIKIPEDLKIDDDKVYLKKVGNTLYVIPFHNPWQSMMDSLDEFTEDFMAERNEPKQQARESLE